MIVVVAKLSLKYYDENRSDVYKHLIQTEKFSFRKINSDWKCFICMNARVIEMECVESK